MKSLLLKVGLMFCAALAAALPVAGAQNIALGSDPSESDSGWGGGSSKADMVDGLAYYTNTWAHGLAFTGGVFGYAGPCGWRQATLNFGAPKTFDRVRVWHHGADHIPTTYRLDYWDGAAWQPTGGSSSIRWDLETPPAGVYGWGAIPTEHIFPAVTGSKVRFVLNNCNITHGWIYEFEVFGNEDCPAGATFSDVTLPRILVNIAVPTKPWQLAYDALRLDFHAIPAPADALCAVQSDTASLPVLARPAFLVGLGPFLPFATSTASANLTIYKPGSVVPPQPCHFGFLSGVNNDCILNGAGAYDPNTHYAQWQTSGFTTTFITQLPQPLSTGPLSFWVDLGALGLQPGGQTIDQIIRRAELYIHGTLIQNLPSVSRYTIIQDPGRVTLRVTDPTGDATGAAAGGAVVTEIPASLYYPSADNPGILLAGAQPGTYMVEVTGIASGDFNLSLASVQLPDESPAETLLSGFISEGTVLVYEATGLSEAGGPPPTLTARADLSLDRLIDGIAGMSLPGGKIQSLIAKLQAARRSLERGNPTATVGQLGAFMNEVEAQRGKAISEDQAALLVGWAQEIVKQLQTQPSLR
jgi:FIMAH domain-containing protein